ncbi:hypothetical protein ACFYPK_33485 [Streptomyces halstedii]|uniref:hypothetical protein n=1 Tax=Streptomyces halstedii TaxID=1944 RepID=UPI00346053FC
MADARSIATGDTNVATAVLGSHSSRFEIIRANSFGIQARITVSNTMSISSFAHVATGYNTPADRFIQRNYDSDGFMGFGKAHDMTITFRTVIYK